MTIQSQMPLRNRTFRIDDAGLQASFWKTAEKQVLDSLRIYAEKADADTYRRRLFSEDAVRGFAFVDLCLKRYDIVVMNPPFGELPLSTKSALEALYSESKSDICGMFVLRALHWCCEGGLTGSITNRTPFFLAGHEKWRARILREYSVLQFADLGDKVLDALVETASYVIGSSGPVVRQADFYRLVKVAEKEQALQGAIAAGAQGHRQANAYRLASAEIQSIPAYRFSFWLPEAIRMSFDAYEAIAEMGVSVDVGISTKDDFRFVRTLWEVEDESIVVEMARARREHRWMPFAKGGEYSPYYGDIHLVVNWADSGAEISALVTQRYPYLKGNASWVLHPESHYTEPGLTYSRRTTSAFGPRLLPEGCIFNDQGIGIFTPEASDRFGLLALLMSRCAAYFMELSMASADAVSSGSPARQYETSVVGNLPSPLSLSELTAELGERMESVTNRMIELSAVEEPSMFFVSPLSGGVECSLRATFERAARRRLSSLVSAIEDSHESEVRIREAFGFEALDCVEIDAEVGSHPGALPRTTGLMVSQAEAWYQKDEKALIDAVRRKLGANRSISKKAFIADRRLELISAMEGCHPSKVVDALTNSEVLWKEEGAGFAKDVMSYLFGVAMGRWDVRRSSLSLADMGISAGSPALPAPPGMLPPTCRAELPRDYPVDVPARGVLVDDESHEDDIVRHVREALSAIWQDDSEAVEEEICQVLGIASLRDYFAAPTGFFGDHLRRYSRSRRQAPIYWPLSSPSGMYTVWLYYHRLTGETLYTCVNDFIEPRIARVEGEIGDLRSKQTRLPAQERELERQCELEEELRNLSDEVLRIAEVWRPDLNDGVVINAAPLWRLFRLSTWRKRLIDTWEKLQAGEFDWTHLAASMWPERVVRSCHQQRSYAISHDLEDRLWQLVETGEDREGDARLEWRPRTVSERELSELVSKIQGRHGAGRVRSG